jgi:hypothetical protein
MRRIETGMGGNLSKEERLMMEAGVPGSDGPRTTTGEDFLTTTLIRLSFLGQRLMLPAGVAVHTL